MAPGRASCCALANKAIFSWAVIEADWKHFQHAAKRRWDRLGEQQLSAIGGRRHLLVARVRDAYGISHSESERQVAAWLAALG